MNRLKWTDIEDSEDVCMPNSPTYKNSLLSDFVGPSSPYGPSMPWRKLLKMLREFKEYIPVVAELLKLFRQ